MENKPPEVPVNYFGKGRDYDLPDDAAAISEFERRYQEWERQNPDDPAGEVALARWERDNQFDKPKTPPPPKPVIELEPDDDSPDQIRLQLPEAAIRKLKNYAKFHRKRPRDIILGWIHLHAKVNL